MSIVDDKKEQINKLNYEIIEIQSACSHPDQAVVETNRSDRDNYDRPDTFWLDKYCSLCHRRWKEG